LPKGRKQPADDGCHFVFDSGRSRSAPSSFLIIDNETEIEGPFLDFRDPWGDPIEIVDYENIQFTKAPNVLRGMGLEHLTKSESARQQLTDKGMGGTDPFAAAKVKGWPR
jgi:lactoylglutathione lyase